MRFKSSILPILALGAITAGAAHVGGSATATANNNLAAPTVGALAPEWTLKDPDGNEHALADYRGKVVVLDFWATWCGPCRKVMPEMQKLHEDYKDRGVVVIGMNGGERGGDPVKFMNDKGYTYQLLLNAEGVMSQYGVTGIPAFFVISADGKLAWNATGAGASTHKKLIQAVEHELGKM